MNQKNLKLRQLTNLKRINFVTILVSTSLCFGMIGCATVTTNEQNLRAILTKEKALIEALKTQREGFEIIQELQKSETLMKAEQNLLISLNEILSANKVMMNKVLKDNKEGDGNERIRNSYH
ncbi:MAG TPA: hypothetical protein VF412_19270 [Bdellovibrio sp.]|uniref:hypothetical protein n=1 Tax=Bdellovibrio sp. TaxID=28201 RepID=UPI002EE5C20A